MQAHLPVLRREHCARGGHVKCTALIYYGKQAGRLCGRDVRGFVAPGHGRCGQHLNDQERMRVRAVLDAERELRALRGLPPEPEERHEDDQQPRRDEQPNGPAHFEWPEGWTELLAADKHVA